MSNEKDLYSFTCPLNNVEEIKSIKNQSENKQPSNIEAEQALLGSILVNNDIIDEKYQG